MNIIQEHLIKLLGEVDDICQNEQIPYFLFGMTALQAYRNQAFDQDCYDVEIIMTASCSRRFINAFTSINSQNRYCESMINSANYPDFSLRYGSTDTLDFSLEHNHSYIYHGLHITIYLLRENHDFYIKKFIKKFLEIGWDFNQRLLSPSGSVKINLIVIRLLRTIVGAGRVGRLLFQLLSGQISTVNQRAKKYIVKSFRSKYNYFPITWFNYSKKIVFEGRSFPVFLGIEEYLDLMYGHWRHTYTASPKHNILMRIIDLKLPFDEYLTFLNKSNINRKTNYDLRKKLAKVDLHIKPYRKMIKSNWAKLQLALDRVAISQNYMPKKMEIFSLYYENRWIELDACMSYYLDALYTHYQNKLALFFDADIFELAKALLNRRRILYPDHFPYNLNIEKLTKMIPKPHKKISLSFQQENVVCSKNDKKICEASLLKTIRSENLWERVKTASCFRPSKLDVGGGGKILLFSDSHAIKQIADILEPNPEVTVDTVIVLDDEEICFKNIEKFKKDLPNIRLCFWNNLDEVDLFCQPKASFFSKGNSWGIKKGPQMLAEKGIIYYSRLESYVNNSPIDARYYKIYTENRQRAEHLYTSLADDASKQVLASRIKAAEIEDDGYIMISSYQQYLHPSFYFDVGSVIIDAGIFDELSPTIRFSHLAGQEGRVVALEPLAEQCNIAQQRLINFENVTILPVGLHEKTFDTWFHVKGAGSRIAKKRSNDSNIIQVPMTTLDSLVEERNLSRIDLIKLDIEKSELPALRGARNVLERFKPNLAICLYHGYDVDVLNIFEFINNLQLGYKFYLGAHSAGRFDFVLYAQSH
jgi:FkbM family methyltransferase